jgi:hypothetical protein
MKKIPGGSDMGVFDFTPFSIFHHYLVSSALQTRIILISMSRPSPCDDFVVVFTYGRIYKTRFIPNTGMRIGLFSIEPYP